MAVITISREIGSGGAEIARRVAAQLGYGLVDKRILEKALQQYGLVHLNELYDSAPGFWARYDDANLQLIAMANKIIRAFAQRDKIVILGRGGFAALGSAYADVLHIRIQAPFEVRAQTVQSRENIADRFTAEELVRENDKARRTFIKAFYDAHWDTATAFHLVLDTNVVKVENAVEWITTTAHRLEQEDFKGRLTTSKIITDPILNHAISQLLEPNF